MTDDTKTFWQKKLTKYSNEDWANKPSIFATQAINYFPKPGKILELGAGLGQDTIFFAQKGFNVTSTDLIDLFTTQVPEDLKPNIDFQTLDLTNHLPFPPQSFDIVYSHLALHYFDKQRTQQLFNEIYEVLKPGGILAVLTNTIDDPETKQFEKLEDDYYQDPSGVKKRFFSSDSLKEFTSNFETILLDNKGETHKDEIKTLIRFIGKKK